MRRVLRCFATVLWLLPALVLFCGLQSPWAKVHSWMDERGVLHFSDRPRTPEADRAARATTTQPTQEAGGPIFMWTVSKGEQVAYLLGSLHYAPKELYPLDPRIEEAFAQSRLLAVESDVLGKQAEIEALTMELGMYPMGDSLEKHISRETRKLLEALGVWNPLYQRMKPWLLAMQLQSQRISQRGYRADFGLDQHFLRQARERNMPVRELERAQDTLRILANASEGHEDTFLAYSIKELERTDEVMSRIAAVWKTGDAQGMHDLIFEEIERYPEFREFGRLLFDERNVTMAAKVDGYLRNASPAFVVVGAGHLVGPMGIPALLQAKGYDVAQTGAR